MIIFSQSSVNGTTGTSVESDSTYIHIRSLKEPDTILGKTLDFYITGSSGSGDFKQYIKSVTADSTYSSKQSIQTLITSDYESTDAGKLGFEVRGDGWQISKNKLKPTQEESFHQNYLKQHKNKRET